MRTLILVLSLFATPALADDGCADLWFTRNLVMDRAGYCFGTVLGRAVFDDAGCTGKTVTLDADATAFVTHLRELEAKYQCRVDTARPVLDLDDTEVRRTLMTLPVRDEFESACLGWQGPETPLRAGAHPAAPVIGRISPGAWVGFAHIPVGDWTYVTTHAPGFGAVTGGGWIPAAVPEGSCRDWAG